MLDSAVWRVRGHTLSLSRPIVMGILNVTPDSFSDGGAFPSTDDAIRHGLRMVDDGAGVIDVGGESTRPYADPVSVGEELDRTIAVIEGLAGEGVMVSIDTRKPEVAEAALAAGAVIVNDVGGMRDPAMRAVAAAVQAGVVIMHMQGEPSTMQDAPVYTDVVGEVRSFLASQSLAVIEAGVPVEAIAIDPGIGFGKTIDHNLELLAHLESLTHLGYPVLVGASRKRFLGSLLEPVRGETKPSDRDAATAATTAVAVLSGARIIRVHNVPFGVDVAVTAMAMVSKRADEQETDRT